MKIILLKDVKGKGKKDQIVDVAQGYANHLIVTGSAAAYNDENTKLLEERKEEERENLKLNNEIQIIKKNNEKMTNIKVNNNIRIQKNLKLKEEIDSKQIECFIKIGANGKTFGQITKSQVCDEFVKQTGIKLNKQKLEMNDIHGVGITEVKVKLDADIIATFKVKTTGK